VARQTSKHIAYTKDSKDFNDIVLYNTLQ